MHEHIEVIPDKCRACRRCEVACIAAHHGMTFKEAMKHRDELVSRVQVVKTESFKTTVRCHQCDPAPCCNVCPTGALQQEDGRIIVRVQFCAACKMCLAVCPYGAISLEHIGMPGVGGDSETMAQRSRREVAVRCDMCQAWRDKNGKKITACMEACPARALSMVEPDGTVILPPAPEAKPDAASGVKQADPPDKGAAARADAPAAATPDGAPETAEKPAATEIVDNISAKPEKKTAPARKK
jgi:carbon-monoxide dehydrogenase iron sulfur subunit